MKKFLRPMAAMLMLGLVVVPVHAGKIGLRAIEGRVGFVDIGEGEAGSTFILSGSADLGQLTRDLILDVGVDYWSKSWDAGAYEWSWTNIGFNGNIRYDLETRSKFKPFFFAGLGASYQSWDWTHDESVPGLGLGDLDDSSIELGINVGAGTELGGRRRGMRPVARIGYNSNGGADYLYISCGLKFPVGRR